MSKSYKAIVNFKTMQVRLKEYGERIESVVRYPNGHTDMMVKDTVTRQWDIQLAYWSEHTSVSTEDGKTLYLECDFEGNSLSFMVYDSLHNQFDVTLKVRMKKFKNWNEYVHPDMQQKMDDTTEILEEATRIVRERAMLRESEAMLKQAEDNFNARQKARGVSV